MRLRKVLPALAAALAVAAALGPPAAAAPGEGGGASAGPPGSAPAPSTGTPSAGGGAAYGDAPKPKAKPKAKAKRRRKATPAAPAHHAFPIAGVFAWGGADGRFGAKRRGHRHQGQDLPAASGTPVVAPYRGVVTTVGYQAKGAGRYVVIHADDYDYVFMHLRTGSTLVSVGEAVSTGQQIGEVGSTGESSGPHLHFELWVGTWYEGGHPIDPLPLLEEWASPASG
jgi:murein DD-endopeptidase MepM/ murein hydrolase activator NlpD